MSRRIVLVGNAPLHENLAAFVDRADHVVRFNGARGFGAESGSRVDALYLVNHGGQMAEWLAEGDLARRPAAVAVRAGGTVMLPVPMLPGHLSGRAARALARRTGVPVHPDRINHGEDARRVLEEAGCRVEQIGVEDYERAQRALGRPPADTGEHYPSTGFVAIVQTLARARAGERIVLCGFTFEGWRGHSWAAERNWVMRRAAEGALSVRATGRCALSGGRPGITLGSESAQLSIGPPASFHSPMPPMFVTRS